MSEVNEDERAAKAAAAASATSSKKVVDEKPELGDTSGSLLQASNSDSGKLQLSQHQQQQLTSERPASACCSLTSLEATGSRPAATATTSAAAAELKVDEQRRRGHPAASSTTSSSSGGGGGTGSSSAHLQRKSSLNIGVHHHKASTTASDQAHQAHQLTSTSNPASSGTMTRKGSVTGCSSVSTGHHAHHGAAAATSGHGRAQLKGAQSICTPTGAAAEVEAASVRLSSGSTSGLASNTPGGGGAASGNMGELERELESLRVRLDRGGVKMSKVTQSYLGYFNQWAEYDPFIAQPIPSNPWQSDSTELWDSERQTKDVHFRRVRRWAFSLKELLNDPAGREQFHRFLEKEFSAENLK